MSEGTAVPYVRRWAITQMQANSALDGVNVQYSPPKNMDEAVAGDDSTGSGDIEAIYWDRYRSTIDPRAFKGTANIKYREEAASDLIILVAARDQDATLENVESRAGNLLGEVIKTFQEAQPGSPGAHLPNISVHVASVEADPGLLSSAGSTVYAVAWRVEVRISASVEQ